MEFFMTNFRYKLDDKKPHQKFTCPECGKPKVFTRYIDTITGDYLPEKYGICDRADNCTYHLNPFKDEYYKTIKKQEKKEVKRIVKNQPPKKASQDKISFIQPDTFKQSLKDYENNNFIAFLINLFGRNITTGLIEKYYIGTSKLWSGATIFWKIDIECRITAGKIMLYNPDTGKRVKEPFSHVNSVHNVLKLSEPRPFQCLFGEHLLNGNNRPIALVESEKSAIIASVYLTEYIWLATGSLSMFTADRCKVLKGRNVTLYPDLNGFEKWSNKAKELKHIAHFSVSDLLETKASEAEKKQGLDIADYLIKIPLKDLFKAEFLNGLLPEYQLQVWHDYKRRGLHPIDAKAVTNELINEHGFTIIND